MSTITMDVIKELRETTGVSVMQCKRALEEAGGDVEKALIILRKQSGAAALKKADRSAADGLVVIKEKGNEAVLLVLNCETDFVAKNVDFIALSENIADYALEHSLEETKEYAQAPIAEAIQKIGENIQLGSIQKVSGEVLGSYVHNGKNGALVVLSAGNTNLAKDIAMHVSAMRPTFITREEVTEADTEKAKEVFRAEVEENGAGKPEEIKEKMLQGKLDSFIKEQVLMEQFFIKDPSKTIAQLLKEANATIVMIEKYSI